MKKKGAKNEDSDNKKKIITANGEIDDWLDLEELLAKHNTNKT